MKTAQTQLPPNWVFAQLSDVSEIISGYGFPESLQGQTEGEIPFYKVGDISEAWKRGAIQLSTANHYVTQKVADSLNARLLPPFTTVFAKIGAAIALNRRAMLSVPSLVDNNVMGLHPIQAALNPAYLFYFVCTLRLNDISQATTVPSIRKSGVERIRLPLPPVREQARIVSEVEKQFTRLDAAVAALKRVQINLRRYRAAVLKAACEGRLVSTEAELARREARPFESASVLLERVLTERRSPLQANQRLDSGGANGLGSASRRVREEESTGPDPTRLPPLPEGWVWTSLGQLFSVYVGATPSRAKPEFWMGEIPWVSSGEVGFCRIRETREKITSLGLAHTSTSMHPPGTVLLGMIGEGKTRGQVAILEIEACNNQNSAAIRVPDTPIPPEYVYRFLEGEYDRTRRRSSGGNQPALNKERVKAIPFPLPPLAEIQRIVAEVERYSSLMDQLEKQAEFNLEKAERLRQATLKHAFEGRLAPQDPNDEPASVLLARIRADRSAAHNTRPTPRGRRKKEAAHVS